MQKESWSDTVDKQSTLSVGVGGLTTRKKVFMEKQRNLRQLAESFANLEAMDYLVRVTSILKDDT